MQVNYTIAEEPDVDSESIGDALLKTISITVKGSG